MRSPFHIPLLLAVLSFLRHVVADDYLRSTSLEPCMDDSLITASLFDVTYFPGNSSIMYNINANASVTGNVSMSLQVIAYGYYLDPINVDPCAGDTSLSSNFCPIETAGAPLELKATSSVPKDILEKVPCMFPPSLKKMYPPK
jgi:hypothetical protein